MLEFFRGTIQNLLPKVHLEVDGLFSGRFCLNETQFYGIFNTSKNFEGVISYPF